MASLAKKEQYIGRGWQNELRAREEKAEQLGCDPGQLLNCPECEKWFNGAFASVANEGQKLCSRECLKKWESHRKPVLTLREFCEKRFERWCESTRTHKAWRDFYRVGVLAIKAYPELANLPLDGVSSESIADFASHRQVLGLQASSINSSLRVLRRIRRLAAEWGELAAVPLRCGCSQASITANVSSHMTKNRGICRLQLGFWLRLPVFLGTVICVPRGATDSGGNQLLGRTVATGPSLSRMAKRKLRVVCSP